MGVVSGRTALWLSLGTGRGGSQAKEPKQKPKTTIAIAWER